MNDEINREFKTKLLPLINTKRDVKDILHFFDSKLVDIFMINRSGIPDVKEPFSWISEFIKEKKLKPAQIRNLFEEMRDEIRKLFVVKIAMPFTPSKEFIKKAVLIFDKTGLESSILDISVDRELVEGPNVFIGGKYINLSIRKRVKNYLLENNVISRYLQG